MWSLVKGAVGVRYIARIAVWSLACGIPGWSLVACVVGLLGWSPAVHVWSRVVSLVYRSHRVPRTGGVSGVRILAP